MIEQMIEYIIVPSNLLTVLLLGFIIFWYFRLKKTAVRIGMLAIVMYFILASGPVSQYLLSSLEYRYPAFPEHSLENKIDSIVVLTGDAEIKPLTPLSSSLNASSAFRLIEAFRIHQMYPQATIIISGADMVPDILKRSLISMGMDASLLHLDNQAMNTFDSGVNLLPLLKDDSFVLVTSAGHMPRAMAVFKSQGLNPVPAPTEFISRTNIFAAQYLPTSRHLVYADLAIHEYLALFWYSITNKI